MKILYTYISAVIILLCVQSAHAQFTPVRYLNKSGAIEAPAEKAYYYETIKPDGRGGGVRKRFLVKDSTQVKQLTYSDLDGGVYNTGILDGPYMEWHENGKLKYKGNYEDGKLSGKYNSWYEDGQLQYRSNYKNDQLQDSLIAYYEDGAVRRVEFYEKGDLVSGKVFDKQGKELKYFPMMQMPQFPGGELGLMHWLARNIKYPKDAVLAKAEGMVFVSFVVNKDGKITDPEIIKSFNVDASIESLRVVNKMRKWDPGMFEGEPVSVRYTLPVRFALN